MFIVCGLGGACRFVNRRGAYLLVLFHGDFLKFGGLLAADAVARLERLDIADLAEIADAVEFTVFHGVEMIDLERSIRRPFAFDAYFPVGEALIFQGIQIPGAIGAERVILALNAQRRPPRQLQELSIDR